MLMDSIGVTDLNSFHPDKTQKDSMSREAKKILFSSWSVKKYRSRNLFKTSERNFYYQALVSIAFFLGASLFSISLIIGYSGMAVVTMAVIALIQLGFLYAFQNKGIIANTAWGLVLPYGVFIFCGSIFLVILEALPENVVNSPILVVLLNLVAAFIWLAALVRAIFRFRHLFIKNTHEEGN